MQKGVNMTVDQIARYTALVKRKSEILLHSGVNWKPEYSEELMNIDRELAGLRRGLIVQSKYYRVKAAGE